jgi:ribonuclease-3
MTRRRAAVDLETRLGYAFKRPELLAQALTHPSAAQRHAGGYERLEFLGDRVLALVVAETLFSAFAKEREGALAKRHAGLVRQSALVEVARRLDLGRDLSVSKGEEDSGARDSPAVLADTMEAVIAALYLDGGIDAARAFIVDRWTPLIAAERRPPQDAKTFLQEWAQGRGRPLPRYESTAATGPAHAPRFTVAVHVEGEAPAEGEGSSKRAAEQAAARAFLRRLGIAVD